MTNRLAKVASFFGRELVCKYSQECLLPNRGVYAGHYPTRHSGSGFGFIRTSDGQQFFFHRTALQQMVFDGLKEGTAVEFELQQSEKGPRAANVRPSAG
jgi:CspA family cold shock protein